MPRAKRGFKRRRRHNKIRDRAEGFVLGRGSQFRRTAEAVDRAHTEAYKHRRAKKRDFRQLWIARLAAAVQPHGLSYSRFIAALKGAKVALDRKVLSDLAIFDAVGFKGLVDQVRSFAPAQ